MRNFAYRSFKYAIMLLCIVVVSCSSASGYDVKIKNHIFSVELAITPQQQKKGLGGRSSLNSNSGMLFIYDSPQKNRIFWMKGVSFSIDIIWINTGRVIYIEHDVPPPEDGMPERAYPRYGMGILADAVLELASGVAKDINLQVGDSVFY